MVLKALRCGRFHWEAILCITRFMKSVIHKKRGPPATGKTPVICLRIPAEMTARIDDWAKAQNDKPPRSEAIRRLLAKALRGK